MTVIKADFERNLIRREYEGVHVLLRRIFKIPSDEMVLSFEWDKNRNSLVLITIKD